MDLYSNQLKLNASFIGSLINNTVDWSKQGDLLSIHSVFKRVVNINTSKGLISIVTKGVGRSPSYIVIDQEADFLGTDIRVGDLVRIDDNALIFESLKVDISSAKVWKDVVDKDFSWKKSEVSFENLRAYKASVDRYYASDSAWEKIHCDKDFNERINKLKGKNPSEAISSLIGLGPGLTPTGDDVLLGFLSVVNTCYDYIPVREAFINEIRDNLKCTSDISGCFLQMGTENHYHEYIQNLIYSIVRGLSESIPISVKKLLSIGATSGTDIATGIYLGFSV